MRRGVWSGLIAVLVLAIAALPSRLAGRLSVARAFGGLTLDLAAVALILVPLVALVALLVAIVTRKTKWQTIAGAVSALPFGFALWALSVTAQEVKSERGSFPTMFDLHEGTSSSSILGASVSYLRYQRLWLPAIVGLVLLGALLAWVFITAKKNSQPVPWRSWALGLVVGLFASGLGVVLLSMGLAKASNAFSPAALGDPLTGLVESTVDLLKHQGPATPRQLVLNAELPPTMAPTGAALLGWPPFLPPKDPDAACWKHPHARPLDHDREKAFADPRGRELVAAFERISEALFLPDDPKVAVFQLSLEGFRSDDLHALNPVAPREMAPFTTSLYEDAKANKPGVLVASRLYQAGVRTAHCLGAMLCGVGTLPYNLSFIRDLHPFAVRCASDVLTDAGFHHWFFYGSDAGFDGMRGFLGEHGYTEVVSQAELPKTLPKGTWDGIVDFAVFDESVNRVQAALAAENAPPQFALVMSLSNHSPFTTPEDLPVSVRERVEAALKKTPNRADADDRLRLLTHSYTDAAVERLFEKLQSTGLAERSVVMLMADHSTGHPYVWGQDPQESDDAKARIPFAIVIPPQFVARAKDPKALAAALADASRLLEVAPLSQNDVPTLLLALFKSHPAVKALPEEKRWHSLGGQVTSPHFQSNGDDGATILSINGVSELFALDVHGQRVGNYEDSVFLKTRADRYRVTPRLIPIAATLTETMNHPDGCTRPVPKLK